MKAEHLWDLKPTGWFTWSFFSDGSLVVNVRNAIHIPLASNSDVHQGSVIGSVLFQVCVDDLYLSILFSIAISSDYGTTYGGNKILLL